MEKFIKASANILSVMSLEEMLGFRKLLLRKLREKEAEVVLFDIANEICDMAIAKTA